MNTELIKSFMRRHFPLVAAVAAGSGVLVFFLILLFPDMQEKDAYAMSENLSELTVKLFGDPLKGFTEIHAWADLQMFNIAFWVIYGFLASILAAYIIAGEIENKTLDILLTYPITRTELIQSRIIAIYLLLALSVIPVFFGVIFGIIYMGYSPNYLDLFFLIVNGYMLAGLVASLALFISVFFPNRIVSVLSAMSVVVSLFFFEEMLVPMFDTLEYIAPLGIFNHYKSSSILCNGEISCADPFLLLLMSLVLIFASIIMFKQRDIPL